MGELGVRLIITGPAKNLLGRLAPETAEEAETLGWSAARGDPTSGRGPAAIAALRALAARLGHRVRVTQEREAHEAPPPRLVVVQRGESARPAPAGGRAALGAADLGSAAPRAPDSRRTGPGRPPAEGPPWIATRDAEHPPLSRGAGYRTALVTPPTWLDATGRPRPTRASWTCGREVAPMRLRASTSGRRLAAPADPPHPRLVRLHHGVPPEARGSGLVAARVNLGAGSDGEPAAAVCVAQAALTAMPMSGCGCPALRPAGPNS